MYYYLNPNHNYYTKPNPSTKLTVLLTLTAQRLNTIKIVSTGILQYYVQVQYSTVLYLYSICMYVKAIVS